LRRVNPGLKDSFRLPIVTFQKQFATYLSYFLKVLPGNLVRNATGSVLNAGMAKVSINAGSWAIYKKKKSAENRNGRVSGGLLIIQIKFFITY
jgi:hypothetical protein